MAVVEPEKGHADFLPAVVEGRCQQMTVVLRDNSDDSAARRVERELRKAIITLEIHPGASLSEKELAVRYGVSRQPVREALINLGKAGLVGILPRRGTFVTKISLDLMRQARFIRESVEVAVVRRACISFDPAVRQQINDILDRQAGLVAAQSHYLFQREDEAFHAALANGTGFPSAWATLEAIKAHMDRVCHLTLPLPETLPKVVDEHWRIIDAIDAHDADRAEVALKVHLDGILKALPRVQEQFSFLFI